MDREIKEKLMGPYTQLADKWLLPDDPDGRQYRNLIESPLNLMQNSYELYISFERMSKLYEDLDQKLEDAALVHKNEGTRKITLDKGATAKDIDDAKNEASEYSNRKNRCAIITMPVYNKGDIERILLEFSHSMIGEFDNPDYIKRTGRNICSRDVERRCTELLGTFDKPSGYVLNRQEYEVSGNVKLVYGLPKSWMPGSSIDAFIINSRKKAKEDVLMKSLRKYAEQKVYNSVLENLATDPKTINGIINPGCSISNLCAEDINAWTYTMPSADNSPLLKKLIVNPIKGYLETEISQGWQLKKSLKLEQETKKNMRSLDIKTRKNYPKLSQGNAEIHWQDIYALFESNWIGERESGKMPRTFFEIQRLAFLPPGFFHDENVVTYLSGFKNNFKNKIKKELHNKYRRELEQGMDRMRNLLKAADKAFSQHDMQTPEIVERMENSLETNMDLINGYKKRHNIRH